MTHTTYPSIAKFQQFVNLKDFRPPTKKEYVRYVRKCAEHFGCDPITLTEDQLRGYFLFLRQVKHYSHVHYLVPGGGLTPDGLRWKRVTDPQFFLPTRVLAARFKNRLRQWLEAEHPPLLKAIPARAWRIDWVADVQPVGRGQTALRYLAAYVQKTALSPARLVDCDKATVTFTHQERQTGQTRTLRLSGQEFLRRFLQHVLPTGFQRVRHFGWLSPAARKRWERIQALLDWKPAAPPAAQVAPGGVPECPRCQKPMRLVGPLARPPPWMR